MTTALRRLSRPTQHDPDTRRVLGHITLTGVALFAVSLGSFAPETAPDPGTATAAQVRRYAAENAATIQVNALAGLASVVLLVAFLAALAHQVKAARPRSVVPGIMIALAGVVALGTLFTTAVTSVFARPDQLIDVTDDALMMFWEMGAAGDWLYTLTVLVPCMVLMAMYSLFALRARPIARWVAWAGLAVAVTGTLSAVGLFLPSIELDAFVLPLFGWWLWPLLVGGASGVRWWRTRDRSPGS